MSDDLVVCSECKSENRVSRADCWHCGAKLDASTKSVPTKQPDAAPDSTLASLARASAQARQASTTEPSPPTGPHGIALLFSFRGRAGRKFWWLTQLAQFAILIALGLSVEALDSLEFFRASGEFLGVGVLVALIVVNLSVNARRLHDIGASAWNMLWFCIPILGPLAALVVLGFFEGTPCSNRFGSRPD